MGKSRKVPDFDHSQARELAGKPWVVHGVEYRFPKLDKPGDPPWNNGFEGIAYPLHGPGGAVVAYIKFFKRTSRKRLARTTWLVGQDLPRWVETLAGAPYEWADTRDLGRPAGINFDFAGCLSRAVPGRTWLEVKDEVAEGELTFSQERRQRCAADLIRSLAVLERAGIVHGDLSPNNILVAGSSRLKGPALYVIDFDGFVAPAAGVDLAVLSVAEGGTSGSPGYRPPGLEAGSATDLASVAPYSDRHARDLLLLELLCFGTGFPPGSPPSEWDARELGSRLAADAWAATLGHLKVPRVFSLREKDRPSSEALAGLLGLSLPPLPPRPPSRPSRVPKSSPPPRPKPPAIPPQRPSKAPTVPARPAPPRPAPPPPPPAPSRPSLVSAARLVVALVGLLVAAFLVIGLGLLAEDRLRQTPPGERRKAPPEPAGRVGESPPGPWELPTAKVQIAPPPAPPRWKLSLTLYDSARAVDVAFSEDGRYLASVHNDASVRLWRVSDGTSAGVLAGSNPGRKFWMVAFSPDGERLAAGCLEGYADVWNVSHPRPIYSVEHERHLQLDYKGGGSRMIAEDVAVRRLTDVAFSPDGRSLATCGKELRLWVASTGAPLRTLDDGKGRDGGYGQYEGLAFSPDGKLLFVGDLRGRPDPHVLFPGREVIRVEDVAYEVAAFGLEAGAAGYPGGGRPGWRWACDGGVRKLEVSPDGRFLAACGAYGNVTVWRLGGGGISYAVDPERGGDDLSVRFARDDDTIIGSGVGAGIRFVGASGGRVVDSYLHAMSDSGPNGNRGRRFATSSTAFNADGSVLAAGCIDGRILVLARPAPAAAGEDARRLP